jgi:hypothetical protein
VIRRRLCHLCGVGGAHRTGAERLRESATREYPYGVDPRPSDHTDAAGDLARDLADIAGQLASLKGEANTWLRDPIYATLRLMLEAAHSAVEAAAVEARRRVRLNERRER